MMSSQPPDDLPPPGSPPPSTPPRQTSFGGQPSGSPYGRPAQMPASKRMAGWALALSLAICIPFAFLVAIGLAIAVLVKSRDGRDHGKGMAIAALVISSLLVVLNVVVTVVIGLDMWFNGWDETARDEDGRVTESGLVSIDRLRVGDCVSEYQTTEEVEAGAWATGEVTVVPCDEPHRAEVFTITEVDPTAYVDQESLDFASANSCLPGFKEYVGEPYRTSSLELIYYNPAVGGDDLLDNDVVCLVTDPNGLRNTMMGHPIT